MEAGGWRAHALQDKNLLQGEGTKARRGVGVSVCCPTCTRGGVRGRVGGAAGERWVAALGAVFLMRVRNWVSCWEPGCV